jgi:hypothetical protein
MPVLFPGGDARPSSAALRRLADDLDRLAGDGHPTASDLRGAPLLDCWRRALRPTDALIGFVTGHPNLRDGRPTLTSDLFAIGEGFARTFNRWYRLGDELPPAPVDAPFGGRRH